MSSSRNGNSAHSNNQMDDALNRIMAVASATNDRPDFIPSAEWKGSKDGYFFGLTKHEGLGYHLDANHVNKPSDDVPPTRKRARISADELLKQAEASVDPHSKIMDLTDKGVKLACASLQKALAKNAMQRGQHPDSPQQYMESELALHEQIQSLGSIASAPALYPTLVEQGVLGDCCTLLSHENTDIAIAVVKLLVEWLDPTLPGVDELAEPVAEACLDLVVANLGRLNLTEDEDREGMELILTLIENLVEINGSGDAIAKTALVPWLFQHFSDDRVVEVLALVFQQGPVHAVYSDLTRMPPYTSSLVEDNVAASMDGLECILQEIAKYRKKQPETEGQVEYLENICTIMASALTFSSQNAPMFLKGQGMELVLRCLREKIHSGGVALQLLDIRDKASCEHLVVAGGLKSLFPIFIGRSIPKPALCSDAGKGLKKARKEWLLRLEQNMIHIIYNWTRFLDENSPDDALERFIVKFLEKDCEKCDRLVELLLEYDQKTRTAEYKFYRSDLEETLDQDEVELAVLEAKLSGGGEFFHRLGAIAAFACVRSKTCHSHILTQLSLKKSGIGVVKLAVEEFISVLEDGDQKRQLNECLGKI
jgi:beta-catenin-like protein 1